MKKLTEADRIAETIELEKRLTEAIEKTPRGITPEEIQRVWKKVCDELVN